MSFLLKFAYSTTYNLQQSKQPLSHQFGITPSCNDRRQVVVYSTTMKREWTSPFCLFSHNYAQSKNNEFQPFKWSRGYVEVGDFAKYIGLCPLHYGTQNPMNYIPPSLSNCLFTFKPHEVGTFTSKWHFAKWDSRHSVKWPKVHQIQSSTSSLL